MKKILNIVQGVEDEINSIILEAKYPVHQVEDTINTILRHLATLRKYVQENGFKSEEDEIHFFKNVKPKVVSRLMGTSKNRPVALLCKNAYFDA